MIVTNAKSVRFIFLFLIELSLVTINDAVIVDINIIISIWSVMFMVEPNCMTKFVDNNVEVDTSKS